MVQVSERFVHNPEVQQITGLSSTTLWRLERAGKFPKKIAISPGRKAWLESTINTWIAERAANLMSEKDGAA